MQFRPRIAGALIDEYRRFIRINVLFVQSDVDKYRLSISWLMCKATLRGFYYISFFKMVTRCASVNECVALLDAIASELDEIKITARQQQDDEDVIDYLVNECIPLEQADPVRLRAIELKIQRLRDDLDGFIMVFQTTKRAK